MFKEETINTKNLKNILVCLSPVIFITISILEYIFVPNYRLNKSTNIYLYFLSIQLIGFIFYFILALINPNILKRLRYKAPLYSSVYILLTTFDLLTLKSNTLIMPYFPWVDNILNAIINDRSYLLKSTISTLKLLLSGYFIGGILGLITGVLTGYHEKIKYWIMPFMRILGTIPPITLLPVAMTLIPSLRGASLFVIILGVFYAVTTATYTGIANVPNSYFDVAKTLGLKDNQLILNIAIPNSLPNIFQGLVSGMSTACISIIFSEGAGGTESGLGWYMIWKKSWAKFPEMYGALIIICCIFLLVYFILDRIKGRCLKWQEGILK